MIFALLVCVNNARAQSAEDTRAWLKDNVKVKPTEYSDFKGLAITEVFFCDVEIAGFMKSGSLHIFVVPLDGMEIKWNGEIEFSGDKIFWNNVDQESASYLDESTFFRLESINGSYDEIRNKFNHLSSFCDE